MTTLQTLLTLDQYPRSARVDPAWLLANRMGPNVIWLAEALSQVLPFEPGQRVLDLGCGRAISSIFLAREFGVRVWATDLWIPASENWARIQQAGLDDQVCPIHAEAHQLPFAEGFFDVIVSLDAYHYFGTDDLYLGYLTRFLKPGGRLGIISPGLVDELNGAVPPDLAPYWSWDFCSFHSAEWWRNHLTKTGLVTVDTADLLPEGWRHWLLWQEVCFDHGYTTDRSEATLLRTDAGRTLGFARVVATRNPA